MKPKPNNKRPSRCLARLVRLDSERYRIEKIEAYNVAINALRHHESADPDPDGLDAMLREKLANKLDGEIQRWFNSLPNDERTRGANKA